jgi:hypothetical protein
MPRRLGPKRANNIRKLFGLDKSDPVTQYVVRRTIEKEGKKTCSVAPKVQRLITPVTIQRKRKRAADKVRIHQKNNLSPWIFKFCIFSMDFCVINSDTKKQNFGQIFVKTSLFLFSIIDGENPKSFDITKTIIIRCNL